MPTIPRIESFIPSGRAPDSQIRANTGATLPGQALAGAGGDISQVGAKFAQLGENQRNEKRAEELRLTRKAENKAESEAERLARKAESEAEQLRDRIASANDSAKSILVDGEFTVLKERMRQTSEKNSDEKTYQKLFSGYLEETNKRAQEHLSAMSEPAKIRAGAQIESNQKLANVYGLGLQTAQVVKNARGVFDGARKMSVLEMNPEKLAAVYSQAVTDGIFSAQEVEKFRQFDLNQIDANKYADGIKNNLWIPDIVDGKGAKKDGLPAALGIKNLTPQQLVDFQREKAMAQSRDRSETMKQLDTYRETSSNPIGLDVVIPGFGGMTLAEIRDQKNIDGKWVERLIKTPPIDDPGAVASILSDIGAIDPIEWSAKDNKGGDGAKSGAELQAEMLARISGSNATSATKGRMMSALEESLKTEKTGAKTSFNEVMSLASDYDREGLFLSYELGKDPKGGGKSDAKLKSDIGVFDRRQWRTSGYVSLYRKMESDRNYMAARDLLERTRDNAKDPSKVDYLEVLQTFIKPFNEKAVAQAFRAPPPKSALRTELDRRLKAAEEAKIKSDAAVDKAESDDKAESADNGGY